MKIMKSFFKQKETLVGIAAAIAFQLIFVTVWLTAYDGVYDRTNQFSVGIVSNDDELGKEIIKKLEEKNVFQLKMFEELNRALEALDKRNVNMVIHLPDKIIEKLTKNSNITVYYYINQATPTLTKQMMEKAANKMNDALNDQFRETINTQIAKRIPQLVTEKVPDEKMKVMIKDIAVQIIDLVQKSMKMDPVEANIVKTNNKEGFAITMVPLLIVLASYISAMLISQYLQIANGRLINEYGRFSLCVGRQMINVLLALGLSLLSIFLMNLFHIELNHNFFVLWGFQSILFFSFLVLSQVFVMLFGIPGMIFNIALTAIQIASSGAMVPRELLPTFYYEIGNLLPATYGVNSYFSLIYGGGDLGSDLKHLSMIILVFLTIAIVIQIVFSMGSIGYDANKQRVP
ncbi:YhgE/Pip domain-containing protein [Geobacillus thermocatenulatus]|uniref:YhgE/Pip domain-containing protein n=1 Tax=Geobacillus thermocatenulatus TaxID=33938 RepID=UPI0004731734|nr:ABC transporter permease [Geobacillus thermocatenulatus]